jgi:uncharacterized membrane protein YphA (DoxX/SURF4 family)
VSVLDALFWVTCLVVVVAGVSKLLEPASTATTLGALGVPGGPALARAVGALEVVLGLGGLVVGGPWFAAGVALSYAVFAGVVVLARRRDLPSCGCFGARSAPPSPVHVVVNAVSAAVAGAAALAGPVPVADGLSELGGIGVVVAGLLVLATVLVIVVDTTVADLVESMQALRAQAS